MSDIVEELRQLRAHMKKRFYWFVGIYLGIVIPMCATSILAILLK